MSMLDKGVYYFDVGARGCVFVEVFEFNLILRCVNRLLGSLLASHCGEGIEANAQIPRG